MILTPVGGRKPVATKFSVIVSPYWNGPVAVVVKFAVQVARALIESVVELTVTAVGVVAATRVTPVALAAVVSALVLRVGVVRAAVLPLVTPRIWRLAAVEIGSEQTPPLSARVIVSVVVAPLPVAEQFLKPLPRMIVPPVGARKPAPTKFSVIESPFCSEPVAVVVKFAVQVARALIERVVELTVTAVGVV